LQQKSPFKIDGPKVSPQISESWEVVFAKAGRLGRGISLAEKALSQSLG